MLQPKPITVKTAVPQPTLTWLPSESLICPLAIECNVPKRGIARVWHVKDSEHGGWLAVTSIQINQQTELNLVSRAFFDTCETAQVWCEQYLRGRFDVQFYPAEASDALARSKMLTGPWACHLRENMRIQMTSQATIYKPGDVLIAELYSADEATLFTAAPDMLKALKDTEQDLEIVLGYLARIQNTANPYRRVESLRNNVRAAIAHATGSSSSSTPSEQVRHAK